MKKLIVYITSGFLVLIIIFLLLSYDSFFRRDSKYTIKDNSGNIIKGSVFTQKIKLRGQNTEKLVLYFDEVNAEGVLIILPSVQMIGYSEGGKNSTFRIFSSWLYQTDRAKIFTPVNNKIHELITSYTFSRSGIKFNTFGELKRYGDEIFIVREK